MSERTEFKEERPSILSIEVGANLLQFFFYRETANLDDFRHEGRQILTSLDGRLPTRLKSITGYLSEEITKEGDRSFVEVHLPRSSSSFLISHASLNRTRLIPDFPTLLRRKIVNRQIFQDAVGKISWEVEQGAGSQVLVEIAQKQARELFIFYQECLSLYKEVSESDVPLYKSIIRKLKSLSFLESAKKQRKIPHKIMLPLAFLNNVLSKIRSDGRQADPENTVSNPPEVFHGRDAMGLYLGRKAEQFGKNGPDKRKLIYVITTRALLNRSELLPYLYQEGVTFDTYHMDTGYSGSTPKSILVKIAADQHLDFTPEDINRRIKLMYSEVDSRESLGGKRGKITKKRVGKIEARAEFSQEPGDFFRNNGRIKPRIVYRSSENQIKEWVVAQAIIRALVPKRKK